MTTAVKWKDEEEQMKYIELLEEQGSEYPELEAVKLPLELNKAIMALVDDLLWRPTDDERMQIANTLRAKPLELTYDMAVDEDGALQDGVSGWLRETCELEVWPADSCSLTKVSHHDYNFSVAVGDYGYILDTFEGSIYSAVDEYSYTVADTRLYEVPFERWHVVDDWWAFDYSVFCETLANIVGDAPLQVVHYKGKRWYVIPEAIDVCFTVDRRHELYLELYAYPQETAALNERAKKVVSAIEAERDWITEQANNWEE